jgi:hypothetical protein
MDILPSKALFCKLDPPEISQCQESEEASTFLLENKRLQEGSKHWPYQS